MNTAFRMRQIWTIARLQLSRVFFSKRSFWVYGLAIFPAIIFLGHGASIRYQRSYLSRNLVPPAVLEALQPGDSVDQVLERAPHPSRDVAFDQQLRRGRLKGKFREEEGRSVAIRFMTFFDGSRIWTLNFEEGILQNKSHQPLVNLEDDRRVFALVFQHYYLQLAVFFGCLGIFMNLFRGEMLDKTLHFWFLAPARREVLLAGKYLAGLIAAVVIFTAGSTISYAAMMWAQDPAEAAPFLHDLAVQHALWYAASAALGAVGYGSVFLAAGLLLRNPILPAVAILTWEGINGVLPNILQKFSVIYYVQSLTPTPAPTDPDAPLLIRLLTAPAEPPPVFLAILGLLAVTLAVLYLASRAVRRLEVNYGTE